jgi:asparaginyl-tRNA synthetase
MRLLHEFFHENDFVYVHTPIITSNDAEGAGEAFRLAPVPPRSTDRVATQDTEFFNKPSYLTVSSQLHLEVLSNAVARVWTLSPCFRAERSQTSRHLAEFWMLEAEWSFVRSAGDICDIAEASIKHVLRRYSLDRDLLPAGSGTPWTPTAETSSEVPWARITYTDAIHELQKSGAQFEFAPRWGSPLQSEHERWLADSFARGPIFVTDYPAAIKPFYMRLNDDGKTVACFDLLVPHVGELVGGSLREERSTLLEAAIKRQGLDEEAYRWYTELRKFGGAPHGGFGMGFERLISWLGGIENVRECIPMPRWSGRMLL